MRIVLFSKSFGGIAGGIEKMSLLIAAGLVSKGHSVLVISIDKSDASSFYKWPEGVDWLKLDIGDPARKSGLRVRFARAIAIRKAIRSYSADSVVGFQVGAFAMVKLATLGLRTKVIAAERNAPTLFKYIRFGLFKRFGSHVILSFASAIAVQFPEYKSLYPFYIRWKVKVTPNPVPSNTLALKRVSSSGSTNLLFVGRLTYQKNVQVLLKACSELDGHFKITIIGEGTDKPELEMLARKYRLNVVFLPPTSNLTEHFLSSDFLVMPSRWEGFPNVVAESLSFGLPVVAFNECSGMSQLITDGVSGVLAHGNMTSYNLSKSIRVARETPFDPETIRETMSKYTHEYFIECWVAALI